MSNFAVEPRALLPGEKLELLQLLYTRLPQGERLKPATKAVLFLYADKKQALHWSNARIAECVGYSLRSVCRANVELRKYGIITSTRRRRATAQKYVWLETAREVIAASVTSIKRNCVIAVAHLRARLEVPRSVVSNHLCLDRAPKLPPVALVSDLSPQLRRLMLGK